MRMHLIEYDALDPPEGMEGWTMYRIEYGGHGRDCVAVGTLWMPVGVGRAELERTLERLGGGE